MVQLEKLDGKLEAKLKEVQDGTKPQKPNQYTLFDISKAKSPSLANRKKSDAIQTPVESVVSKYKKKREECIAKATRIDNSKTQNQNLDAENSKYAIIEIAQR